MAARTNHAVITESLADSLIAEFGRRREGGPAGNWGHYAGVHNAGLAAAYDVEVAALLRNAPWLKQAVRSASRTDRRGGLHPQARAYLIDRLNDELNDHQSHVRLSLEALLGADGRRLIPHQRTVPGNGQRTGPRPRRAARRGRAAAPPSVGSSARRVFVPLLWLNGIVFAALAAGPLMAWRLGTDLPANDARAVGLAAFAVWALAFMPGWLFVRFLDRRAGALWDEYVIHLHRLGLDDPGNLPEPPRTSDYHDDWAQDGGLGRLWMRNVYREKFDAYYGPSVSRSGRDADRPVQTDALFPVFLCTALLAVGWTAILYDPQTTLTTNSDVVSAWTMLSFGFVGAYVFFLQTILRRYFQADLRAGAYVSGYIRVVTALLVVAVLIAALPSSTPPELAVAIAFVVGWFPHVGLQWLARVVSRRLRATVPSVDPAYTLNRLDGLNVWYEARLLEEGIEDLENLVTAKVVDVMLHTRVPVARLVDWVDQALLLIYLPAEPPILEQPGLLHRQRARAALKSGETHPRHILRDCGVRSATALLRVLHDGRDAVARERLLETLEARGLTRGMVLSLRDVVSADRRLAVVWNWQSGDAEARHPLPLDPVR